MKERSLILFTLCSQAAAGLFWTLFAVFLLAGPLAAPAWLWVSAFMGVGMAASFFHLGTPANAWRAAANLRRSWLSREILFALLFTGLSFIFAVLQITGQGNRTQHILVAFLASLCGLALVVSMSQAYCLRTVPAWNTRLTPASFFITAFLLGSLSAAVILQFWTGSAQIPQVFQWISLAAVILLALQLSIVLAWLARLKGSEAALSARMRVTRHHRAIFWLRLGLGAAALLAAGMGLWHSCPVCLAYHGWSLAAALTLAAASETLGRLLFYAARVRRGV